MASNDRMLRLTATGIAAANGPRVLFRAPCIECGKIVDVTRFGPFSGPQTHTIALCRSIAGIAR